MRVFPGTVVAGKLATCWLAFGAVLFAAAPPPFVPPKIEVPAGFVVELAAGPPLVKYPMMACLDPRGRLFVAETQGKNLDKEGLLRHRGRFIRMLEDTDQDGRYDRSTIFADQLVMPEGAVWYRDSLYVLSSPYLWRFRDRDDDGVADEREKLVGAMEFNGKANQHGAYLGPNGRLYFSGGIMGYDLMGQDGQRVAQGSAAGIFSCRPDGSDLQVFANGGINPVEVVFTPAGELLSTCAIFDNNDGRHDALIHWIRGATAGPTDFNPPVLQQTGYRLPALSRWGQVAPAGLMRYRSEVFGPQFRHTYFATHFNTGEVVQTRISRHGATFQSADKVFLTSPSRDFHPTDVLEDADGTLLVIDTGGWFRISCPLSQTAKPNILGAIYRIRREGAPAAEDPRGESIDWEQGGVALLVEFLDDPRPAVRDRAVDALSARGATAVAALTATLRNGVSAQQRRNACWALSRIGTQVACRSLEPGLEDPDPTVRQATVRSLGELRHPAATARLVEMLATDTQALRRAAATALGQIGDSRAVPHLLRAAAADGDEFFKHAVVYALIEIGDFETTLVGLHSNIPAQQQPALVALDQMAPSRLTQAMVVPLLNSGDEDLRRAALAIITTRDGWDDATVDFLRRWFSRESPDRGDSELARGALLAYWSDDRVKGLVRQVMTSSTTSQETRRFVLETMLRGNRWHDEWNEPLLQLLHTSDAAQQLLVVRVMAGQPTTAFQQALRGVAEDPSTTPNLRSAAWSGLAESGARLPSDGLEHLVQRVTGEITAPLERLDAARAIASADLDRHQLARVAASLADVGPLELPTLLATVERVQEPGERLGQLVVKALQVSTGTTSLQATRLRRLLKRFPQEVQQEAEPLLARLDLDDRARVAHVAAVRRQLSAGSAAQGKLIFYGNRAACSACHRVGNLGGRIGPDLSHIGQIRTRDDLLESILFPSATLASSYETYSVSTHDGKQFLGVIERSTDRAVVLRGADREAIVVERSQIAEIVRRTTSIMPQGLDQAMRKDELSDLLAYLESLKP